MNVGSIINLHSAIQPNTPTLIKPKSSKKADNSLSNYKLVKYPIGSLHSGHAIEMHAHIFEGREKGPCILLLAGMHGDEINGVEILRRTLVEGLFKNLKTGKVIVVPLINVVGFINFSRDLPDGKDINRSFPGSRVGSLASRLARCVTDDLLPEADYVIDFHTGGNSRYNYPQVRYTAEFEDSIALARVFGASYMVRKALIHHSLRATCYKMKVPSIVFESGESKRYDGLGIEEALSGIKQLLVTHGMGDFGEVNTKHSINLFHSSWIRAKAAGLFIWERSSGEYIKKGDILGRIHDPHDRESRLVKAHRDAYIIGHNNAAVVSLGDALFHLGWEDKAN